MPIKDITGCKFGRLTVLQRAPNKIYPSGCSRAKWECICECGNKTIIDGTSLRRGMTKSCGCLQKELLSKKCKGIGKQKGDSKNPKYERLYRIWKAMHHRCYNPNDESYKRYGMRGIIICQEWHNWDIFKEWALNNGYSDDLTIDRINNNGNYEPLNCRWATYKEQANNASTNKMITYHNKTQTLSQWCDELGLNYHRTKDRLNRYGYTIEQAFEKEKYEYKNNYKTRPPKVV